MPRSTKKDKVIEEMYFNAALDLIEAGSEIESEAEEIEMNLEDDLHIVKQFRFGHISKVPKQTQWVGEVLPNYDETRFKQVTRVTFSQFDLIYNLIKDNQIFKSSPQTCKQQIPVSIQLAITLYRLGTSGNGASISNIARLFGVGDGSTITRLTRRVFQAILDVENQYVFWPSENERKEKLVPDLPNCVGFMDGIKFELDEAPHNDKEAYYDKDSNYSIQTQLICDLSRQIRHYVVGYPGSCHDSRVWNECNLSQNPDMYFSSDQWLCADKGYGLSKLVITPFRVNSRDLSKKDRKWFNKYFSGRRVIIEHVNGVLKETFESLKSLRVKIHDDEGHEHACIWIRVCIILYNIILPTLDSDLLSQNNASAADYLEEEDDPEVVDDFDANDKRMALFYLIKENLGK